MDIKENISKILNEKLRESGMTLEAFSEYLGVARSSLQNYLKGTANIRFDTVELMAERMGMTTYELMCGIDYNADHKSCFRTLFAELRKMNPVYAAVAEESLHIAEAIFDLSEITSIL